jgi:Predicted acyltransferases
VAVICFYFISGFLMHRSYKRFQQHAIRPVFSFYRDRVIKLLPQYFLVVTISFLCLAWLGTSRTIYAFSQDISLVRVILNYLVLPANYVIPPFVIEHIAPQPIVATAWSLATEFQFYLILPMIFLLHRTQWTLLILTVMAVQFSSFFFTRINFNSFNYGYYYIFGVLTVFLYGYAFAGREDKFFRRMMLFIWGMYVSFSVPCGAGIPFMEQSGGA